MTVFVTSEPVWPREVPSAWYSQHRLSLTLCRGVINDTVVLTKNLKTETTEHSTFCEVTAVTPPDPRPNWLFGESTEKRHAARSVFERSLPRCMYRIVIILFPSSLRVLIKTTYRNDYVKYDLCMYLLCSFVLKTATGRGGGRKRKKRKKKKKKSR